MDAVDCLGEVNATEHEQCERKQAIVGPTSADEPIDAVYNQENSEQDNGHEESKLEKHLLTSQ
jgi:hypothetical protein